ncbi:hypothetical protein PQJ75_02080 [Rhodoplanes sp. TEM]|uniref:Uncharacterized protein n=1 Tax=Rhodoplanes tepidamans TaxID=200616 RepID=A0ABT5J5Z3_RHOTP|nr:MULTISPECIES: hypothetical protein [Rhodoplanes]MDC7785036.1 hypothetical protein [Rhodoplanes tepidamans]MDC7982510.1 hypothetical protein [Rhodoplanes sp. TEM]MDQ0356524.1 hypothetical protein [Rhodoplanes tepidamans]
MLTKRTLLTTIPAVLAGAALVATGPALAHNPQPRHGGRIVIAGNFHVELVIKGATVSAYLLGHDDKPRDAAGHQGLAILVVDGKSQRVPLAAAEGNRLDGTAPAPLPDGVKGVVQITTPTGATAQAKFN